MFIPASFRVEDRETLFALIERYSFATLVSIWQGAPFASHVPLVVDRDKGLLLRHLARGNPQEFITRNLAETVPSKPSDVAYSR